MSEPLLLSNVPWIQQQIIHANPSAIILVDAQQADFPIVYANHAFERNTGYCLEEVLGKNPRFLHRDDNDQRELDIIRAALVAETACAATLRNYRKDGSMFWNEMRISPIRDENGTVTHFVGVQNDVTARKAAEAALARSEDRYHQIFDSSKAVKLVIDPQTGRHHRRECRGGRFLRLLPPAVSVDAVTDYRPAVGNHGFPDDAAGYSRERSSFECRHRLASGEVRDVDVFLSPVDTAEGAFLYTIIIDATGKREAELRYRSLFEQSNDAVFILDLTGRHLQVNRRACDMLGYPADEMLRLSSRDMVVPEEYQESRNVITRLLAGEQVPPYERTFRRKDGSVLPTEINVEIVRDRYGHPIHIQSIVRDITQRKQMENALRQSEERMHSLIQSQTAFVIRTDMEGNYTYANAAFATWYGCSPEELIGMSVFDTINVADHEKTLTTVGACLSQPGVPIQVTLTKSLRDGMTRYTLWEFTALEDNAGNIQEFQCIGFDTTKQREMEAALLLNEARYRTAIEASMDAYYLLESVRDAGGAITDFQIVQVNENAVRELGLPREQLTGGRLTQVFPPDRIAASFQQYKHIVETGELVDEEYPDGQQGSRWYHHQIVKAGDGVAIVNRNISSRKQAEEALRRSEESLRLILQGTRAGTWEWNIITGENIVNDQWANIVGYTIEELSPVSLQTWLDLVHPDDRPKIRQLLDEHFAGTLPYYECEVRLKHKEGHWVWVWDRGQVMEWTADGQPVRMFGTHLDITAQKQAQQRDIALALEKERTHLLTHFIQGVSHEFRTPLSIISSSAYIILRSPDRDQHRQKTAQIDFQVKRITRLVDMLMMMSKLESGVAMPVSPIDIGQLTQMICQKVEASYGDQPLLRCEIRPSLPIINGNIEYFVYAIQHLIENAYRFTPPDGTITVTVDSEDNWAWVEVRDTGAGIGDEDLPRIFETFWRRDEAHSTPGFGLGLPIAQRIIEHHGGVITVESQVGHGSCFRVTLPAAGRQAEG